MEYSKTCYISEVKKRIQKPAAAHRDSKVRRGRLSYPFWSCFSFIRIEKFFQIHQGFYKNLNLVVVQFPESGFHHFSVKFLVMEIGLPSFFRQWDQNNPPILCASGTGDVAFFTRLLMAIVSVPTVTDKDLATAVILRGGQFQSRLWCAYHCLWYPEILLWWLLFLQYPWFRWKGSQEDRKSYRNCPCQTPHFYQIRYLWYQQYFCYQYTRFRNIAQWFWISK